MKLLKNSLIFCLIIVIFIGTIGVNVFYHSCSEDGVFTAYFINTNTHCEATETVEAVTSCCREEIKKEISSKQAIEEDCCNDEISYFKASLDYFSTFDIKIPAKNSVSLLSIPEWKRVYSISTIRTSLHYEDPPPLLKTGREILLNKQVFRL
jgi:hypothetical protein